MTIIHVFLLGLRARTLCVCHIITYKIELKKMLNIYYK
jgi:hypothetical protein